MQRFGASNHPSLVDVKSQWAQRPMFSASLSRELDAYTARAQRPAGPRSPSPVGGLRAGPPGGPPMQEGVYPASAFASPGHPWRGAGPDQQPPQRQLPPQIPRPHALQLLLHGGPPVEADADAAPPSGLVETPRQAAHDERDTSRGRGQGQAASAGRARRRRRVGGGELRVDTAGRVVQDQPVPAGFPQKSHTVQAIASSADEGDMTKGERTDGGQGIGDEIVVSSDESTHSQKRVNPVDAEGWMVRKLEVIDDQIERAASRRAIQEERLKASGVLPPGTKVSGESQTAGDFVDGARNAPNDGSVEVGTRGANSSPGRFGLRKHAAVGKSLMVAPGTPGYRAPYDPMRSPPPRHFASTGVGASPPRKEPSLSWATTPPDNKARGADATAAGQEAAAVGQQALSMRAGLMNKLDELQLANEEELVKHGVLHAVSGPQAPPPGMPALATNTAGDIARGRMAHAQAHVAAAHRRSERLLPGPIGGYGSVTEPGSAGVRYDPETNTLASSPVRLGDYSGSNVTTTHLEDDRWRRARTRMDQEKDFGGGGVNVASLRMHASEIASASSRGIGHAGQSGLPRAVHKESYSAKKKWGNVSFTLPDGGGVPNTAPGVAGGGSSHAGVGHAHRRNAPDAADPYGFFDQPTGLAAIAGGASRIAAA